MGASIIDVSSWIERPLNTEGTRDKSVLINPSDNKEYYFKTSLKKNKKNYTFEFWSEVIASKIGYTLGFEVADYNVGVRYEDGDMPTIGALVASVHDESEDLVSGYNLVCQYQPEFSQSYKKNHSLRIIQDSLTFHGLDSCFDGIIECMVFDAIIGNTDRHSENWAFIRKKEYGEAYNKALLPLIENKGKWYAKLAIRIVDAYIFFRFGTTIKRTRQEANKTFMRLSPLYDNGSSLGREIDESIIKDMIERREEMDGYICRGRPDIKVRENKVTFLETIECLCYDYLDQMRGILQRLEERYSREEIENIIFGIDQAKEIEQVPKELRLSNERKKFIITIITERIERILDIGNRICVKL